VIRSVLDLHSDAVRFSRFPDGQPHCKLDEAEVLRLTEAQESLHVLTRLCSANDVVETCLAIESIRSLLLHHGRDNSLVLNIGYMLGARMDRRIAPGQPATLHVLAALLNTCNMHFVRVLDPHSPVVLAALERGGALHPDLFVAEALALAAEKAGDVPVICVPDKGAVLRTTGIVSRLAWKGPLATCSKKRDPNTGALSGFTLDEGDVRGKSCLIVDDICDGGGTFSGIAAVLREHGARSVSLVVTHGLFTKGIEIKNIDCIYSTDSYRLPESPEHVPSVHDGRVDYRRKEGNDVKLHVWTGFLARVVQRANG
jgi:ribose-phosphate pyrophosphokinase